MLMMKARNELKSALPKVEKYQGKQFLKWQFDMHLKKSRHLEWLEDLDAMENKPAYNHIPSTIKEFTSKCHCC